MNIMTKKLVIAGEYLIKTAYSGRVDVMRIFSNTRHALRDIAAQMGYAYDENWNTQQLGRELGDYLIEHKEEADKILITPNAKRKQTLVGELTSLTDKMLLIRNSILVGAKREKVVVAGEYIIEISDNGHVDVMRIFSNTMSALRDIAAQMGYAYDKKWNTRQLGRELGDYLIEHKEEADERLISPNAKHKQTLLTGRDVMCIVAEKVQEKYGFRWEKCWDMVLVSTWLLQGYSMEYEKVIINPNLDKIVETVFRHIDNDEVM